MSGHARIAPSSLEASELCPGRIRAIAALPPEKQDNPNIHADTGTAVHDVLSICAKNTTGLRPHDFVGKTITVGHDYAPDQDIVITKELAFSAQLALTYYREREQEYGAPGRYETEVYPGKGFHLDTPQGVKRYPREDCKGTADAIFKGRGYLEVADYKNGRKFVPELNHQTVAYALGALQEHDLDEEGPIQRVRLTIIQPNGEGQRVRTHEMTVPELLPWAVRFGNLALASDATDAPRVYGEKQCYFCPAKHTCPEYMAAIGGTIVKQLEKPTVNATLPPPPGGAQLSPTPTLIDALSGDVEVLTPQMVKEVLDGAPMLRAWLKEVEEAALADGLQGSPPPGYKVVLGRGSRAWAEDDETVIKKMRNWSRIGEDGKAVGKLRREDYLEESLLSPAQAEKRIKPLVTAKVWTNAEKLISTLPGKPTLVPETDSRPPIKLDAAELGDDDDDDTPNPSNAQVRGPVELPPPPPTTEVPTPPETDAPSWLS